jgi:hypothetical protein
LNIYCGFDAEIDEDLINAVFEPIFPFFQNNNNLEMLEFRWEADEGDRWTMLWCIESRGSMCTSSEISVNQGL